MLLIENPSRLAALLCKSALCWATCEKFMRIIKQGPRGGGGRILLHILNGRPSGTERGLKCVARMLRAHRSSGAFGGRKPDFRTPPIGAQWCHNVPVLYIARMSHPSVQCFPVCCDGSTLSGAETATRSFKVIVDNIYLRVSCLVFSFIYSLQERHLVCCETIICLCCAQFEGINASQV